MAKFNNHFGLDIGPNLIKLVQLGQVSENKYKLVAFGQCVASVEERAEAIKKLIKDAKVTCRQVVVSLSESDVYTRVIEMPVLNDEELAQALRWQAEQYIPVPLADVVLKHQVLSKQDINMKVLLVAAPNLILNNYISLLNNCGLETVAIETETLAVTRAIIGDDANSPTTLLVHMGVENTSISIVNKGNLILTQSISTGGGSITRSIVSLLGLDSKQAEEYKLTYGLDHTKLDGKVMLAIKPVIEIILSELKRVLVFYNTQNSNNPVKRLVLTGDEALLPGLVAFLNNNINIEVQLGNPFSKIMLSEQQKQAIGETEPVFTTAVGLSLKLT